MELPSSSDIHRLTVQEFDTSKLLAHAAKQARQRKYSEFMIVDIDSHHYESDHLSEIYEYIDVFNLVAAGTEPDGAHRAERTHSQQLATGPFHSEQFRPTSHDHSFCVLRTRSDGATLQPTGAGRPGADKTSPVVRRTGPAMRRDANSRAPRRAAVSGPLAGENTASRERERIGVLSSETSSRVVRRTPP